MQALTVSYKNVINYGVQIVLNPVLTRRPQVVIMYSSVLNTQNTLAYSVK